MYSVLNGHMLVLVLAVTTGNCLKTGICCVEVEVVSLVVAGRLALAIVIIIDYTGPIGCGEGTVVTVNVPAEKTQ